MVLLYKCKWGMESGLCLFDSSDASSFIILVLSTVFEKERHSSCNIATCICIHL